MTSPGIKAVVVWSAPIRLFGGLAILTLAATTAAQLNDAKALQGRLRTELQGKVLEWRVPYQADHLEFDSDGNPNGTPSGGTRAMDGALRVEKLHLNQAAVELDCVRLIQVYVGDKLEFAPSPYKAQLRIALSASAPDVSINRALTHMFLAANETPSIAPRPDLQNGRYEKLPGRVTKYRLKGTSEWKLPGDIAEPIEVGQLEDGEKVYAVSGAVSAPKAIKAPDPDYPDAARSAHKEGKAEVSVVVDRQGLIHSVAVTNGNPDFQLAMLGILRKWRFQPASLGGQAVACLISIETTFQLAG